MRLAFNGDRVSAGEGEKSSGGQRVGVAIQPREWTSAH